MIKAYGFVNNYDDACQLFDSIQSHDVIPDKCSYGTLLQILARADLPDKVQHYLKRMQEQGLVSDCFTYCAVISCFKRLGRFEEASEIAGEMRNLRILSKVLSYNNVIDMYSLDKRFSEAIETFKEMLDDGVRPDKITFKSLGLVLLKCGISKKTVGRLKSAVEKDYQSGVQAWLIALYTMVDADR
ncbi:Pentatricopeptide repeat-containing protein At3g23020 [Linum perenne]